MLRRKLLLTALTAGSTLAAAAASAQPAPPDAAAFVRQAGLELSAIMDGAGSVEQKRARIPGFIDRVVDVPAVAQFCLGRYWRQATAAQQQAFTELFRAVLTRQVTMRVGDYTSKEATSKPADQQNHVTMGRAETQEDGIHVAMTLERQGAPPANMMWLVETTPAGFRIIDLVVAGTSLRLTQRSDYASYLQRNGDNIDALISALRRQTAS